MRKIVLIAATVILLLFFSFVSFLQYRQYRSYKVPIHAAAKTIVKINFDAFIRSFMKEYGFNFSKQLKPAGQKGTDSSRNTGIYLTANLFIYNLSTRLPSTLFCTIPLNDEEVFKTFLHNRWDISFTGNNSQSLGTASNGELTVLCSGEYAALAFSPQKEEVIGILQDLLNKKNLLGETSALIRKLKTDRSHIVCVSNEGMATCELSGNRLLLHADLTIPRYLKLPVQNVKRVTDTSLCASLYINIKPADSLTKKNYTIKQYNLEADSLLHYFNGYADIEISRFINQRDTIITYSYTDNFEKVESKTIANVTVPAIDMALNAGPLLLTYLQKQKIVSLTNNLNQEIFPLYQVVVSQRGQTLHFNTDSGAVPIPQYTATSNFMEMDINFNKLQPITDSSFVKKYISDLTRLKVEGKKKDNNEMNIEGSLYFESSALKTLLQLIRSF